MQMGRFPAQGKLAAAVTLTVYLSNEDSQQVHHTHIRFKRCYLMKNCYDVSCKKTKFLSARV